MGGLQVHGAVDHEGRPSTWFSSSLLSTSTTTASPKDTGNIRCEMDHCNLCNSRFSSRKRSHNCLESLSKKKCKKYICNPSDQNSGISPDLKFKNFIQETTEKILGCSYDGAAIEPSYGPHFLRSEGTIERGKVRKEIKSNNINLNSTCLACLKRSFDLNAHPIVKGGICSMCSENWLLGLSLNDEMPEYCLICGKKRNSFKCSNPRCEFNSVFCEVCITEYYPPLKLLPFEDWLCILCNPSGSDILELQTNWAKNICHFKFDNSRNMSNSNMNKIVKQSGNPMKVLSLFDGIGSGFVSLRNLGLVIEDYFASEIDEDAIKVATFQSGGKIKHIGDVTALDNQHLLNLGKIDLLIGGSPCTELSLVNPERQGLFGIESSGMLFFEFFRTLQVLKTKNPDILFLFENTAAMTKVVKNDISRYLGCQPVLLDSKLFCPMKRARYFWGNIFLMDDFSNLPIDKKPLEYFLSQNCGRVSLVNCIRTLTTNSNSMRQGPYQHLPVVMNGCEDTLWITEVEKLFGFDEHYTDVGNLTLKKRFTLMGNSWCVPVISYLLRGLRLGFLSIP